MHALGQGWLAVNVKRRRDVERGPLGAFGDLAGMGGETRGKRSAKKEVLGRISG